MRTTAWGLDRSTLGRQLLLGGVADPVRRVVALRAQQSASPCLALWNRLTGFVPVGALFAGAPHTFVAVGRVPIGP